MITWGNILLFPVLHYTMEMAAAVRREILELRPDAIAVELPETMEDAMVAAAGRLPDLSVVVSFDEENAPLYTMVEPCDASFEALRTALEEEIPTYCIDLDVDEYPDFYEAYPDAYAVKALGLKKYYNSCRPYIAKRPIAPVDDRRELYMAKRLKELSLRHEKVLFVCGMAHAERIANLLQNERFPDHQQAKREATQVATLTEESAREVLAEYAYLTGKYEEMRQGPLLPDRDEVLLELYTQARTVYEEEEKTALPRKAMQTLLTFARKYALITGGLTPELFQVLTAAKGCVDHTFAYHTWELATEYKYLKNVDNLKELDLTAEEIWGHAKNVQFRLKEKKEKSFFDRQKKRKKGSFRFDPPHPFSICSYPPEDERIENFGEFLKKKGVQLVTEEGARTVPFQASLEDGIDTKETLRHAAEKKLYVKQRGKPPGGVGSIVIIFAEDEERSEEYPWKTTWLGEHDQESDMAFYATEMAKNVVGPGISRCNYGGFMMSYPPRRMYDIWSDPDYFSLRTKSEVLLAAAIDYATLPLITYVAAKPPHKRLKSYARRYGKKVIYLPLGQLSPHTLRKLQKFHVLDGQSKRAIADEYIE